MPQTKLNSVKYVFEIPQYQDLSMRLDWPVKNAIVNLPIKMTGNSKPTSGDLLSPLGAQNEDNGTA